MKSSQPDSDYLLRCIQLHKLSHDPHRQVGAVIVDQAGNVLGEGANAPPQLLGLTKEESYQKIENDPEWKYFVLEHAERNAISQAIANGADLSGSTMYVSLFPCADCARAIVASGISRLVLPRENNSTERDTKWQSHYRYARSIFEVARIKVDFK